MGIKPEYIPVPLNYQWLRTRAGANPLIINYHVVSDHDLPHIKHLYNYRNIREFRDDIHFYSKAYTFIGMGEFLNSIHHGQSIPPNAAMLTFDDGFREVYETVAPILTDQKIPATLFLTTNFIDNLAFNHDNKQSLLVELLSSTDNSHMQAEVLSMLVANGIKGNSLKEIVLSIPYVKRGLIDEVAALAGLELDEILREKAPHLTSSQVTELIASGFTIGSHGLDHARFTELTLQEQVSQVTESLDLLDRSFHMDFRVFAFPYTDIGITGEFFKKIAECVDASFGTQGLLADPVLSNFQRINGEKVPFPAKRIVKYHYIKRIIDDTIRKGGVKRTG